MIGATGVLGAGVATAVGIAFALNRKPQPAYGRRGLRRARAAQAASPAPAPPSSFVRLAAGVLIAGCLLLPLVFSIAFDDVFALPKTAVLWLVAGGAGILLVVALARSRRAVRLDVTIGAVTVFVVLAVAATILGVKPRHGLIGEQLQYQGLITTLAYVGLFLAARSTLAATRQVQLVAVALVVGGVGVAIYGLAQWFGLDPIWQDLFKDRIFSTVGQANALAATLSTAAVMAIALRPGLDRPSLATLGAALVLILTAFLLTFSRGGYVAFVVGALASGLVLLAGVGRGSTIRTTIRGSYPPRPASGSR